MTIEKKYGGKKIMARLVLLIIPAIAAGSFLLWHLNDYYGVLESQWLAEGVFLAAGLLFGCLFYSFRFRFITTLLPLLLLMFMVSKVVNNIYTGEFTSFFAITKFYIFSFLFIIGWLSGWAFARLHWFPTVLSALLLLIQVVIIANTTDITARKLISAFAPVLVFAFYIIYTAELIRNMNGDEPNFAWFLTKKIVAFATVATIILLCLLSFYQKTFQTIESQYGGGKNETQAPDKESLTKENKDGSVSNKNQMGLSGGRSSTKRLVFIAKLDNYFPNSETPNPLYYTYEYFTKFDTATQTLEIDPSMPAGDLFQPEKEYRQQFKSAYRAKMMVSDLNSAYFIYNPAGNKDLEIFQQQRFELLRQITNWNGIDTAFMNYYTFMPAGDDFDSVRRLARDLTKNALTPIDKIIAIRDYFLSTDETGQPLFKYTENPGVPGLPSASKLNYFLFQNRKGYCAYYAGATLFLLRALGFPTRVATGFLTMDRSTKNKGWYWFYEDQAHAWTQVYFPGYGWIDFDTTIPSTEQQQAPAPDGTPPITVQTALFVTHGKVSRVDTVGKRVEMSVSQMIYHDKTFDLREPVPLDMDVSLATISRDSGEVPLGELQKGNEITALSFSDQFKNIVLKDTNSYEEIFEKIPKPAPIDEIKILDTTQEKPVVKKELPPHPKSLTQLIWMAVTIILSCMLIIFSLPWLIFRWLHLKAKNATVIGQKAYWSYQAATYYLNQLGRSRNDRTSLLFAREKIDPEFKTNFAAFMQVYLKTKYSKDPLTNAERETVIQFYRPFYTAVKGQVPFKERFSKFLNYYRTIHFFSKSKI